ncbi:UNVERIFIED_CONTAM: hypothetical protein GTU68_000039, partial [Idotea baltica]|nr:hypothetical protein [Idotea baltica]
RSRKPVGDGGPNDVYEHLPVRTPVLRPDDIVFYPHHFGFEYGQDPERKVYEVHDAKELALSNHKKHHKHHKHHHHHEHEHEETNAIAKSIDQAPAPAPAPTPAPAPPQDSYALPPVDTRPPPPPSKQHHYSSPPKAQPHPSYPSPAARPPPKNSKKVHPHFG